MDNPPPFKLSDIGNLFEHFDLQCKHGTLSLDVEQRGEEALVTIYNNRPERPYYNLFVKLASPLYEVRVITLEGLSSFISETENIKILDITSDSNSPYIVKYQKLK